MRSRRTVTTAFFMIMAGWGFAAAGTAFSQSLTTSAEVNAVVSSSGTTPFWIRSNRSGVFSPHGSQVMARFQAHGVSDSIGPLKLHYGADLVARPGVASTLHLNQGYVKLRGWGLELAAGRFIHTSPGYPVELGMGSLGVSGNALPIPQVRAGLTDWTSVPFTRDFMQIRGHIAHGWMENGRRVDNVLYHEKVGHARFGGRFPLNLYGGILHHAFWGGVRPDGVQLPNTFTDYWRVFIAISGDEDSPGEDRVYMLGDHKAAWDFGFYLEPEGFNMKMYRQFPIETKDNLKFKSKQDALTGIAIRPDASLNLPVRELVYEFLYTMYQDGPRRPNLQTPERDPYGGNENYYNHGTYGTGWVYNGETIGVPLFMPSTHPEVGVYNNRVVAHHLGMVFNLPENHRLTTKATFSRNYGKRWDNRIPLDPEKDSLFDPSVDQWSFFAGYRAPFTWNNQQIYFSVEAAYDNGTLVGDQFGVLTGLTWNF